MSSSDERAPGPHEAVNRAQAGPEVRADGQKNAWTLSQVLQWTVQRFTEAGLDSPRTDAEYLLAHALGCARMQLYVRYEMVVGTDERARFRELVRRRLAREPVAYIEGRRGFHALDLELAVDKRVLVPRPETELLVDWVLERLPGAPNPGDPGLAEISVLDVGTGSGAIGLSVKRARPDVRVVATDLCAGALVVAQGNATQAKLEVQFVRADLFEGLQAPRAGWSAIVSNPPYIDTGVLAELAPEVRDWEPTLALDGGADGLDVVRRIVADAPSRLAPGGLLALEFGYDQSSRVVALMAAAGLVHVQTRNDHSGHVRMAMGSAPSSAP